MKEDALQPVGETKSKVLKKKKKKPEVNDETKEQSLGVLKKSKVYLFNSAVFFFFYKCLSFFIGVY